MDTRLIADLVVCAFILFFGSSIGSFLNVVVYRLPNDLSVVFPSSFCPACQTPLRAYDNIPVLGYLLLRGKCRNCREPISFRYPAVEAATAIAALSSVLWLGITVEAGALFIFFALLLPASLIDFDYQILPNKITYPGIVVGFGLSFVRPDITWIDSGIGILVGAGVLMAIRILGQAIFKKEAMGLGDVKLLALLGAFLGWEASLLSIFFGSILGTLYSIPILIKEGRGGERGGHMIPFGPFLAGGGLISAVMMKTIWWYYLPFAWS
jgi:leader peptidase (prepilin peptidase) / N-methyltransferase